MDLVPPGSLAAGWRLVWQTDGTKDGKQRYGEAIGPDVGRLWKDFSEKRR